MPTSSSSAEETKPRARKKTTKKAAPKKATKKRAAKKKVVTKKTGKKVAKPSSTVATNLIPPGKVAKAIKLPNQQGEVKQLNDYRGQWVILYLSPKDNTPGCTKQACQFRDSKKQLTKRNAVVLGVSPDSQASHGRFVSKFDLPFDLLADTEKKACEAYGVWQEKMMSNSTLS